MALAKLSATEILDLLAECPTFEHDVKIIIGDLLNSTNDYLLQLIGQEVPQQKILVLAEKQTSGKGSQGRTWVSPPGNIYMSLYWPFDCTLDKLQGLSLVVGVAVARVLKDIGLAHVKLKWPNDIFWQQRKMGGILIETKQRGNQTDTVIGLGLNICDMQAYQSEISQNFVVLEDALQRKVLRNKLIAQLLIELAQVLQQFAAQGFDAFADEWKAFDQNNGQDGVFDKDYKKSG